MQQIHRYPLPISSCITQSTTVSNDAYPCDLYKPKSANFRLCKVPFTKSNAMIYVHDFDYFPIT